MRAIGISKCRIVMLYFYESSVLVIASCLLGVMVGTIMGYTMTLQSSLFIKSKLSFFFPWRQFGVIMVLSFICAFFSTVGPSTRLTRKEVAAIFRLI